MPASIAGLAWALVDTSSGLPSSIPGDDSRRDLSGPMIILPAHRSTEPLLDVESGELSGREKPPGIYDFCRAGLGKHGSDGRRL
jgi:hypothetical protein